MAASIARFKIVSSDNRPYWVPRGALYLIFPLHRMYEPNEAATEFQVPIDYTTLMIYDKLLVCFDVSCAFQDEPDFIHIARAIALTKRRPIATALTNYGFLPHNLGVCRDVVTAATFMGRPKLASLVAAIVSLATANADEFFAALTTMGIDRDVGCLGVSQRYWASIPNTLAVLTRQLDPYVNQAWIRCTGLPISEHNQRVQTVTTRALSPAQEIAQHNNAVRTVVRMASGPRPVGVYEIPAPSITALLAGYHSRAIYHNTIATLFPVTVIERMTLSMFSIYNVARLLSQSGVVLSPYDFVPAPIGLDAINAEIGAYNNALVSNSVPAGGLIVGGITGDIPNISLNTGGLAGGNCAGDAPVRVGLHCGNDSDELAVAVAALHPTARAIVLIDRVIVGIGKLDRYAVGLTEIFLLNCDAEFDAAFQDLHDLTSLTLVGCRSRDGNGVTSPMGRVPPAVMTMANLETLRLNKCGIREMPTWDAPCRLRDLDLCDNEIEHVPSLANLPELWRLNLMMNRLVSMASTEGCKLTRLNLAQNQLAAVPDLVMVTKVATVDGMTRWAPNDAWCNLSNNQFAEVPMFTKFPRTLNVSHNNIVRFDAPYHSRIRTGLDIDLRGNPIDALSLPMHRFQAGYHVRVDHRESLARHLADNYGVAADCAFGTYPNNVTVL